MPIITFTTKKGTTISFWTKRKKPTKSSPKSSKRRRPTARKR